MPKVLLRKSTADTEKPANQILLIISTFSGGPNVSKPNRQSQVVDVTSGAGDLEVVRMALDGSKGSDDISHLALRRRLHALAGRVERVKARGGDYAMVGLSGDVKTLLARLEAGRELSSRTH